MKVVGVVPAAGYATRLGLLTGSKEVLPVGGKPVMDHVIERLHAAPCDEIRVVTRQEKIDVIDHANELGATIVIARPPNHVESILTAVKDLDADDIVCVAYPDTIWEPLEGYALLVERVKSGPLVALGVFRSSEGPRSDVVVFDDSGTVREIHVKSPSPPSNWIWGCCACRAKALEGISSIPELGLYWQEICAGKAVSAVYLSDVFIDIGTPEAWEKVRDRPISEVVRTATFNPSSARD
jgi:glucose-1-phosphate thymidylyltransferase